jgi:16S rRNA (cytosine1402-N4)-methyltransferase
LGELSAQCVFVHGNFAEMGGIARAAGFGRVDGVVLDLGVSSEQLETAERGFSFIQDGPLDMRMDTSEKETALRLVNDLAEDELRALLKDYGEEPNARRIARAVVRLRSEQPLTRTTELADLVCGVTGRRRGTHPATRTFQALRIAVNRELEALRDGLGEALRLLGSGGRLAVVAFHSLEDRIVKQRFAAHAGRWESLQAGGRAWRGEQPPVRRITRKPVIASDQERARNPRSRSAKLRVVERIETPLESDRAAGAGRAGAVSLNTEY